MTEDVLPEYVRALLQPAVYPAPPDEVELVQTHISYVFLAGDVVYKTKKPVDFGFINQLSEETRERFCHAEVELNSRLAPDVYLGVVPVVRLRDGSIHVEGDADAGEVLAWAVKMRRLPDDRTLDQLLARGAHDAVPDGLVERLVRRLVRFHEAAAVVPNDPDYAGGPAERSWWAREFGEAEGNIGGTWDPADATTTREIVERTIEASQALFDERLASGRVVEGHGDLRAAHVYILGDQPEDPTAEDSGLAIVDCIEFTDWFHFRYLDVGYDVAFLAVDFEALGRPDLGDELIGRYIAASHDETLGVLQPLHRTFRAFVRGKVESIGANAPEVPAEARAALAESATRYFRLAADLIQRGASPALILVSGLPSTGKSTVAATVAGRIGAAYLSSDIVRKQLAGIDPRTRAGDEVREGLYSPEMTDRTYDELRRRAAAHLDAGRPVVLDAVHGRRSERDAALAIARDRGLPVRIVELRLTDEAARARLEAREHDPLRTSDATWEIYEARKQDFEPITPDEASKAEHLVLDASRPPADLARTVADSLS